MKFVFLFAVLACFSSAFAVQSEHGILCESNVTNAKMDLVVVVEMTTSTYGSIEALISNILTYINSLNIKNDGNRLALIMYNTYPSIQYLFTDEQSFTGFRKAFIEASQQAPNAAVGNIAAALGQAYKLLKESKRLSQGILLYATTYNSNGQNNPAEVAKNIKADGLKIATVSFTPTGGVASPAIADLASPGLAMDSSHTNMSQFDIVLSSLNCACKSKYTQLVIDNIPYSECFQYYQSLASPDNIFCGNGGIIATTYTKKRLDFITDTIIARTVEAPPKRITVGLNRASAMSPWGWQNYDSTALNYTGYPTFADVVQPDATWGYLENYSGLNWRLGSDNGDISYNYLCATRASDAYLDS